MKRLLLCTLLAGLAMLSTGAVRAGPIPNYDHIVVAIMENRGFSQVIGNTVGAPYINSLTQQGALFTNAHGVTHPSQPNYIALFSGSTQGVTGDPNISGLGKGGQPAWPLNAPNLGAQLLNAGKTYIGYSESLPSAGSTVDTASAFYNGTLFAAQYAAKHNATVMFQNGSSNTQNGNLLPSSLNQPFTSFPGDFNQLPTVSFIAPNQINDMHGLAGGPNGAAEITIGDTWLQQNMDPYVQWAKTHNSLFILTWDEDNSAAGNNNRIPMIFVGANVAVGQFNENVNHFNVLATIEDAEGLGRIAGSVGAADITDVFIPEPATFGLFALGVAALAGWRVRRRPAA